jgi:hypothetical protein
MTRNHAGIRSLAGTVHLNNVEFEGFETAINMNGGKLIGNNLHMQDGGRVGIDMSRGARADVSGATISNYSEAAVRTRNSSFQFEDLSISDNEVGLDLGRGSRGDIIDSSLTPNRVADIRYHRDVIVGVFDTAALDVLDLANSPNKIEEIDAAWIANRILDTSTVTGKARWVEKLPKKVGTKTIETAAWELAKAVLGI